MGDFGKEVVGPDGDHPRPGGQSPRIEFTTRSLCIRLKGPRSGFESPEPIFF